MANYSKLDGYVFDKQSNIGWGLTLKMPSKAPAVAKRIFDTLAHAQEYIDDVKDTAIEGLVLSVVADTDTALNGAYFVKSVGKKSDVEGGENIKGVLVKLGSEDYTDTEIQKNKKRNQKCLYPCADLAFKITAQHGFYHVCMDFHPIHGSCQVNCRFIVVH